MCNEIISLFFLTWNFPNNLDIKTKSYVAVSHVEKNSKPDFACGGGESTLL